MISDKSNPRIGPIEKATNRSWEEWLKFMEGIDAAKLDHHALATAVYYELDGKIDNPGWWAQSVSVAYEQASGRRVPGQRPDGTFQTSVSKSTPVVMEELMAEWVAFANQDAEVVALVGQPPKVAGTENRHTWRTKDTDGVVLNVLAEPKPNGTASLVVQVVGTESLEANELAKEKWTAIVARFFEWLDAATASGREWTKPVPREKKSGMMG